MRTLTTALLLAFFTISQCLASNWPMLQAIEWQPLGAQLERLNEGLDFLGTPLPQEDRQSLRSAIAAQDVARVQKILDAHCLAAVDLKLDGSIKVVPHPTLPLLVEQGWETVLIKVVNPAGLKGTLRVDSPSARDIPNSPPGKVEERWLDLDFVTRKPFYPELSGLELEYRLLQIWSRSAGRHQAILQFNFGTGHVETLQKGEAWSHRWDFKTSDEGWLALNNLLMDAQNGILNVTTTGNNPGMGIIVKMPPGEKRLRINARVETNATWRVTWVTDDPPPANAQVKTFEVNRSNGDWTQYEVDLPTKGRFRGIKLDPGTGAGACQIDSVELTSLDEAGREWVSLPLLLQTVPSRAVVLDVRDEKGKPATACFVIRDERGRVYPSQNKRLAPDFFFHPQVYREHGETVLLPPGKYTVECSRGPESIREIKTLLVPATGEATFSYQVKRWVDPARYGWFSGDHHIHAAGCAHYTNPTEGVHAEDMQRHIMGEDLKVGCNLTWGPCFDYQKQFFSGRQDKVSRYPYLLRYDIEVSGFGSHQSGHLCLLRLKNQMYPGGESKNHWPTLGLNTLRWAKAQGAVCGPAHSSAGLAGNAGKVEGEEGPNGLPNFIIPFYDGIGANEFIVDITHMVPGPKKKLVPAIDFISTMNTDRKAEWNMWYHTLNCGYRVRASGETDFPCVSGERVGMGRVYVKQRGRLNYDDWCEGIREGRSYVSDGTVHLMDFKAHVGRKKLGVGEKGSELTLASPGNIRLTARAAALRKDKEIVAVELIVNGYPAAQKEVAANGSETLVDFDVEISQSSWVALRVFPSAHTNPFFVLVDGLPIRASRASAEWCLKGVDQCWKSKKQTYVEAEMKQAEAAYDHARQAYQKILEEAESLSKRN